MTAAATDPPMEQLATLRAQVEQLWIDVAAGETPRLLSLRRTVSGVLARGVRTSAFWSELHGGESHARHAVRVCMLSLLIGESLDLERPVLHDLGIAALVHDLGYVGDGSGLGKRSSRTAQLMLRVEGHFASRVRWMAALLGQSQAFADPPSPPVLQGRILRIAEDYDDLCRSMCPATALAMMAGSVGRIYCPVAFQALANQLGRFPPGTWLELADGETVRVTGLARDGLFESPVVRNLFGRRIDLAIGRNEIVRLIGHPSVA